jgi:putative ABC transport system permease protein
MNSLSLAFRFARRELRGGFAGFRIFFMCLMLGAASIAGVESLSEAFLGGLADQSQTLLGGDVSVSLVHRAATPQELAFLERHGTVSQSQNMRAMAYVLRDLQPAERQLVEFKTVDSRWPLFGAPRITPNIPFRDAIHCEEDGVCGLAAEQVLLDRMHVRIGDLVKIGNGTFRIIAVLDRAPDRISMGFSLGPLVLASTQSLEKTGLVTPESLVNYSYRIKFPNGMTAERFRADADRELPQAGWQIRDRSDAAPGIKRFVEQITMYLTLVGLTALGVGGVGAGQAIAAFLDRKRADIAILKSLGASGSFVFLTFFAQVMLVALAATVIGALIGAAIPFAVTWYYGDALPVPPRFAVFPLPLLLAGAFGMLSAVVFAVPPLSRARAIPPASLFRDAVAPGEAGFRIFYLLISGLAAAGIAALTLLVAPRPIFAAQFLAGAAASLVVLRLLAEGLRRIVRRQKPKSPLVRLAFANLLRPGAATGGVVTALGLGLTLLATVTLIAGTISAQVKDALPDRAPSFFFVDIQQDQAQAFDRIVGSIKSAEGYKRTPMIRGRIVSAKGISATKLVVSSEAKWAFNGDRGITYAQTPPPGTVITQGEWWAPDYRGPTLISLDQAIADGAGLTIGDRMVLNVLGREIEGRIASLRKIDFTNGGQNFVLVLSPGVIDKAPHSFLATVRVNDRDENRLYMRVTDTFPNISTVRVKDAIAQVQGLLQQLAAGMSAASLVTVFAGLLVLAGAIAAGARARLYDATILKVLGATRWRIAIVYIVEYGVLGIATGLIALVAGTAVSWVVARTILEVPFLFDPAAVVVTVAGGGLATLFFGLIGALAALSVKPARRLRSS